MPENLSIFQGLPYKAVELLGTILAFQKSLLILIVNSKETGLPLYLLFWGTPEPKALLPF